MRDKPSGADLLRAAREKLAEQVLPGLEGERRYAALMVANALGMVERELVADEQMRAADLALAAVAGPARQEDADADARALCSAIRSGRHDGDERLHTALYVQTIRAVAIARPGALTATERQQTEA